MTAGNVGEAPEARDEARGEVIGGAAPPPAPRVAQALAAREAEEFLLPSWTAGAVAVEQRPVRGRRLIRDIIETALLALLVFLAVRASLQNYLVDGYSMYPTLEHGQHILVNKVGYTEVNLDRLTDFIPFVGAEEGAVHELFGGPGRGDIIVFNSAFEGGNDLIKRVIGLPGEQVAVVNGRVYINGFLLEEPYIVEAWAGDYPKTLIPPRHYFVLGDNRNSSQDSRSPVVGLVPRERIVGKALLRYWPVGAFGAAPNGGAVLSERTLTEVLEEGR